MNKSYTIEYSPGKNFGLELLEFTEMCNSLQKGDNTLFEKIYLSHFKLCQNYLVINHNLNQIESYDITMDTLLLFRRLLISNKVKYGNLKFLFTRIAYYQMLKTKKNLDRLDKEEYQYFSMLDLVVDNKEEEETQKLNAIEKAIKKLSGEKQKFLEIHFGKNTKLTDIAKSNGVSDATMRKRKQRILEELRKLIKIK